MEQNKIPLEISDKLAYRFKCLAEYKYEIAGWLTGKIAKGKIIIEDVIIPPQEVSSADVDLDTEGAKWLMKNHPEKIESLIGHVHSHNTMSAHFSPGDERNHEKLIEGKKYFAFIVIAKPRNEKDLFDYDSKVWYKSTTPFGITTTGEIQATINIVETEKTINPELSKLKDKLGKLNDMITIITEKIESIESEETKGIKAEIDKIIEERVKVKTLYSKDDDRPLSLESFRNRKYDAYSRPTSYKGSTIWAIEKERLTDDEVLLINNFILSTKEFNHLDVLVDKYDITGENLCSIFIDCRKKKVFERLELALDELLYGKATKAKPLNPFNYDLDYMTERDLKEYRGYMEDL